MSDTNQTTPLLSYSEVDEALSRQTADDPLDIPLPADVTVNHICFRKGVSLRTFVNAARRWHTAVVEAAISERFCSRVAVSMAMPLEVLTTVPHPSVFIQEEMEARGWDRWALARRMPGDYRRNRLEIDLYFEVGPGKTNMRLGKTGEDIAQAFSVSPEFLRNLETAWLRSQGVRQ